MEIESSTTYENSNYEQIKSLLLNYKKGQLELIDTSELVCQVEEQLLKATDDIKDKAFLTWEQADQMGDIQQRLMLLNAAIVDKEDELIN